MKKKLLVGFIMALLIIAIPLFLLKSRQNEYPFSLQWDAKLQGAMDVSNVVLDAPAGQGGFIQIKDGHFYDGQNNRIRFWGVNMVFAANFPDKATADIIAERIAKLGFNSVRLHHMDTEMSPKGIWKKEGDGVALDPLQLDRLDYFVAKLKEKGVYVNINLHVGRKFTEGEGVTDAENLPQQSKVVTLFDDRIIELQRQYAQDLLTHYNPYTQTRYNEEPALALVEITNENSIFPAWTDGILFQRGDRKETNSLPDYYLKELDKKWNDWLLEKYKTDKALAEAWNMDEDWQESLEAGNVQRTPWGDRDKYSKQRFVDNTEFYYQLEKDYFRSMIDYLHHDLQVQVPITTSNNFKGQPDLLARDEGDYMDVHNYWDHPDFPDQPWDETNFTQTNASIIRLDGQTKNRESYDTFLGRMALCAVEGKPLIVSEWNAAYPNEYEYEAMPIITSYALLQDWDGLFLFSYSHFSDYKIRNGRIADFFDISNNTIKLVQSPQYAMAFTAGMIQPAKQSIAVKYRDQDIIDDYMNYGPEKMDYNLSKGVPTALLYNYKIRKQFHTNTTSDGRDLLREEEMEKTLLEETHSSDTKELTWDARKKDQELFTVDTEKFQSVAGFIKDQNIQLNGLELKVNEPAAFTLVSRDGKEIASSGSMLISLVGKQKNSSQIKDEKQGLSNWGKSPVLMQKIAGTIRIEVKEPKEIHGYYLSPQGERLSDIKINRDQTTITIMVEDQESPVIEIVRE